MIIHAIPNVSIINSDRINALANISFHASPGNIISTEAEASDLTSVNTVTDGICCVLLLDSIYANIDTAAAGKDLPVFGSQGIGTVLNMSSTKAEIRTMRAESNTEIGLPSYLASSPIAAAQTAQRA